MTNDENSKQQPQNNSAKHHEQFPKSNGGNITIHSLRRLKEQQYSGHSARLLQTTPKTRKTKIEFAKKKITEMNQSRAGTKF